MIFVIATIEVAPDQRDVLLEEFHKLIPLVYEEEGCIEYGAAIDVKTNISAQGEARENVVTVIEKWDSVEALEAHLVAPHMNDYRERVKEMVRGTTLQILAPA